MFTRGGLGITRPSRLVRLLFRAALFSALLSWVSESWGKTSTQTIIDVRYKEGNVTITAVDAPLSEVLREIGRQFRIKIVLIGEFDGRITRSFVDASMMDVIRRFINAGAFVIIHGQARAETSTGSIRKIW